MAEIDTSLKPEQMDEEVRHVYDKILPVLKHSNKKQQEIINWLFCTWQIERNACKAMGMELQKHVVFQEVLKEEIAAEDLKAKEATLFNDEPSIEPHSNS